MRGAVERWRRREPDIGHCRPVAALVGLWKGARHGGASEYVLGRRGLSRRVRRIGVHRLGRHSRHRTTAFKSEAAVMARSSRREFLSPLLKGKDGSPRIAEQPSLLG